VWLLSSKLTSTICSAKLLGRFQSKQVSFDFKIISKHLIKKIIRFISSDSILGVSNDDQATRSPHWVLSQKHFGFLSCHIAEWLVGGFNPIEHLSQIGSFPQVGLKIKDI